METLAILIPVKNNANIVARALDSVVNQTAFLNGKFKYQIFLVDNDSSDNLKEVANKLELSPNSVGKFISRGKDKLTKSGAAVGSKTGIYMELKKLNLMR